MFPDGIGVDYINNNSKNTLVEHLGIKILELGKDFLIGSMPVDSRTKQPMGLLHGGASVVLSETLGSIGSNLITSIDNSNKYAVGLEINANHVRAVKEGSVIGTAKTLHIGKKTHIWDIKINNEQNKLVCVSRLTMSIIEIV